MARSRLLRSCVASAIVRLEVSAGGETMTIRPGLDHTRTCRRRSSASRQAMSQRRPVNSVILGPSTIGGWHPLDIPGAVLASSRRPADGFLQVALHDWMTGL